MAKQKKVLRIAFKWLGSLRAWASKRTLNFIWATRTSSLGKWYNSKEIRQRKVPQKWSHFNNKKLTSQQASSGLGKSSKMPVKSAGKLNHSESSTSHQKLDEMINYSNHSPVKKVDLMSNVIKYNYCCFYIYILIV